MDHSDIERMRIELATGLPHRVHWSFLGSAWIFDFSRAQRELLPATTVELSFGTVDPAWSNLYLFGEEYLDGGGSPFLGTHVPTGEIRAVDVEVNAVCFLNSTVRQFIDTFGALERAFGLVELSPHELDATLEAIDPAGYPRSDWRGMVRALVDSVSG